MFDFLKNFHLHTETCYIVFHSYRYGDDDSKRICLISVEKSDKLCTNTFITGLRVYNEQIDEIFL